MFADQNCPVELCFSLGANDTTHTYTLAGFTHSLVFGGRWTPRRRRRLLPRSRQRPKTWNVRVMTTTTAATRLTASGDRIVCASAGWICVCVYVFVLRRVIAVCARARLDNRGSRSKSVLKYRFTERRSQSLQDVSDNSHIYLYARTHRHSIHSTATNDRSRAHICTYSAHGAEYERDYTRARMFTYTWWSRRVVLYAWSCTHTVMSLNWYVRSI